MALAVVTVAAGGIPVVDVTATTPNLGFPITEALTGVAVTKVTSARGGWPVTFATDVGSPGGPVVGWNTLKIGGGGLVTGISITSDNSLYIRTDAHGGYKWNASTSRWDQLCTTLTMSASDWNYNNGSFGFYEIAAAPSLSTDVWMSHQGKVFFSSNSGQTWVDKVLPITLPYANDGGDRGSGPHIAVDPVNPSKLFVGAPGAGATAGLYYSTDKGANWNLISSGTVAKSSAQNPGIYAIAFDPSSSTGGSTPTGYVGSDGTGVYKFTSGTSSSGWTLTTSGPTTINRLKVDQAGVCWVSDRSNSLWRYKAGAWVHVLASGNSCCVMAISPSDPLKIWSSDNGGAYNYSSDGGTTWSGASIYPNSRIATDILWLAVTNEDFMPPADLGFTTDGVLYHCEGAGVWTLTPPTASVTSTTVVVTSKNTGIEELVPKNIISPPFSSGVVTAAWDRPSFYRAKTALTTYPSTLAYGTGFPGLMASWSVDWASSTPGTIGMISTTPRGTYDLSGYSTDGGQTFTPFGAAVTGTASVSTGSKSFTGAPTGLDITVSTTVVSLVQATNYGNIIKGVVTAYNSGTGAITVNITDFVGSGTNITNWLLHTTPARSLTSALYFCSGFAMSTASNMIWAPGSSYGGHGAPCYTTDGGVHWTDLASYFNTTYSLPNTDSGWDGDQIVAADRVTANKFYLYVDGTTAPGVYVSTNSGATWTRPKTTVFAGGGGGGFLKAVPGNAGHVFGIKVGGNLNQSTNSGSTWTAVTNVTNCNAFGFGAVVSSYPTIYFSGRYSGVWGLWMSTDGGASFTQLGPDPLNCFAIIYAMDGDKEVAGKVYIGFSAGANGFAYRNP